MMKKLLSSLFVLLIFGLILWGFYSFFSYVFNKLLELDSTVSAGIIAAFVTVIISTITVMLGRYYERKRDIESHHRASKVEIYDEFLSKIFSLFYGADIEANEEELIKFFQDWQKKIILWGGQEVLAKYIEWMTLLKSGALDVRIMDLTNDLIMAIRKDLGHSNSRLQRGVFAKLLLKDPELYLKMSKENPLVTFDEIVAAEEKLKK